MILMIIMLQLVDSVKDIVAFPTANKANKIKGKYNMVDKSYFQSWLDKNIVE